MLKQAIKSKNLGTDTASEAAEYSQHPKLIYVLVRLQ